MGVLGRRSRVGDSADVAAARLKRGAHDVLDAVTAAAEELADRAATQVGATVTAARRDLADRIDPDPVPRRGLRLLVLGLLVTTVSAVVWAVLARRPLATPPLAGPEHVPSVAEGSAGDRRGGRAPGHQPDRRPGVRPDLSRRPPRTPRRGAAVSARPARSARGTPRSRPGTTCTARRDGPRAAARRTSRTR